MYLIISLLTIIVLLLFLECYKKENFQSLISPSSNRQKRATLHNVAYSANIPGVNSNNIYELPNKCVKFEAYQGCKNNTPNPNNDLNCDDNINRNVNGVCKCLKKDVEVKCDSTRRVMNCNEICQKNFRPKSLEFNGNLMNPSRVSLGLVYKNNLGFSISFYIKLSNFKRFPFKSQMVMNVKNHSDESVLMIYLNRNRKLCLYSYKNDMNYIDSTELGDSWYHVTFGSKSEEQFIQVNDKRKTFINMKIDRLNTSETKLVFDFGSLAPSANLQNNIHNPFKGLLGNITTYKRFLTKLEICENNNYCGDTSNLEMEDNRVKCMFKPRGNNVVGCIRKCKLNMDMNGCTVDECIYKCDTCEDKDLCKWKKPREVYSNIVQPVQQVSPEEDNDKCLFKPWGVNENHCVDECVNGENRDNYGGDNCTKTECAKICKNCENTRFCPWLVGSSSPDVAKPPNPPYNFVGIPASNSLLLMWTAPSDNGSEVTSYKILYYEASKPENGINMRKLSGREIQGNLKHTIVGLKNDVTYNVGIVAINAIGASKISRVISLKPRGTLESVEGFQNYTPTESPENNVVENECSLFNNLRGKTVEISL